MAARPEEPIDPAALERGSQEPLTPPTLRLDVELAPGSTATAAPLVPKTFVTGPVELAPGSTATAAPLVPKTIEAAAAPRVP